jgi:hypothetical protein
MTIGRNQNGRRIVTLAFGLGVMVLSAGCEDGMKAYAGGGPLRCEIEVEEIGSSVQLQGIVYAGEAVQGAYDLQVSAAGGGGSSNIRQQGDFEAAAHEPARLGIVQLSRDGGAYKARLKVTGNGEAVSCEKRIGGGWL